MRRRVAVTGLGVVSSIGHGAEDFWCACLAGATRVEPIPPAWLSYAQFTSRLWSPLAEPDYEAWGLGRIERLQNDRTALIAMTAAFQALEAAGIGREMKDEKRGTFVLSGTGGVEPGRAGVSLGTGIGGISSALRSTLHQALTRPKESLRELRGRLGDAGALDLLETLEGIERRLQAPSRANPFAVAMTMPNTATSALSIKLSLVGPQSTHCAACASGTVAIGHAYRSIAAGEMDLVLAGGVELLDDDYGAIFHSFDLAHTLVRGDDPEANRPFDRGRSGFLFSQGGGAVLVLEEMERARKRGAPILAEVAGFAETSDAHNIMVMEPEGRQIARAIESALKDADLRPDEIDYVNAHGTGTTANDETEAAVLSRIFGSRPLVSSTKSLLGHTLGASGALEAAVTVLSLQHQTTHVCLNLEDPIADLNFVRRVDSHPIRAALSQSFAFGGHNAAVVFRTLTP
jgi:3-oxoacyl-[acyl-carrier-protein] synthase II